MSIAVLFFIILFVVPAAWFLSRQFEDAPRFFGVWIVAALIIIGCLIAFIFKTADNATGGEGGWGQKYKEIGEGKFD